MSLGKVLSRLINFHPPKNKKAVAEIPSALKTGEPNNHNPEPIINPVANAFPGCIVPMCSPCTNVLEHTHKAHLHVSTIT